MRPDPTSPDDSPIRVQETAPIKFRMPQSNSNCNSKTVHFSERVINARNPKIFEEFVRTIKCTTVHICRSFGSQGHNRQFGLYLALHRYSCFLPLFFPR